MTFLALGAKCGTFDAIGPVELTAGLFCSDWAKRFRSSNDDSASAPMPNPDCRKKWRRVICFNDSFFSFIKSFRLHSLLKKTLRTLRLCAFARNSPHGTRFLAKAQRRKVGVRTCLTPSSKSHPD